jgi:hypothetical protein
MMGGDLMAHPQIVDVAYEHAGGELAVGWQWLLREITPIKKGLEEMGRTVFVANLEFPVATEREEPRRWPPRFNGPGDALIGFRAAGVDVVAVTNNHAYDQHREGLAETVAAARAAGLITVGGGTAGEARSPVTISEAEPRVTMLAYMWTNESFPDPSDPGAARIAVLDERTVDEVRAASAGDGLLIVTVHWIGEFVQRPLPAWREWVQKLADAGADAIVCHGPHVVGPVETLAAADGRKVPVVYSLGNLVSNMGWGVHPGVPLIPGGDSEMRVEAREEALAVLRIAPAASGADGPWTIDGLAMIPLWLEDNKPLATARGGPRREIFPRPMPWCVPDAATGCWAEGSERWCAGRLQMILERRAAVLQTIWGEAAPELATCPEGANAYDPVIEFRAFPFPSATAAPAPG